MQESSTVESLAAAAAANQSANRVEAPPASMVRSGGPLWSFLVGNFQVKNCLNNISYKILFYQCLLEVLQSCSSGSGF